MLKRLAGLGVVALVLAGCWGLPSFPPPVTGVQASATASTVSLSWTNPSSSFWGVRVYRAEGSTPPTAPGFGQGPGNYLADVGDRTSFTDTGLSPGTAYSYTVITYGADGYYSVPATVITITPDGTTSGGIAYYRTPDARFANLVDYPFAPHYDDVSGLRMHYVDEGPASGPVVLMLHGEPDWSYLYRDMIPAVAAAGYRVIAPDLIGFGRSDKPLLRSTHTYSQHVAWIDEFITDLGLDDITVVVHDWGGLFGLRVVAEHPSWFKAVIATNTGLPVVYNRPPPPYDPTLPADAPVVFDSFATWQVYSQTASVLPVSEVIEAGTFTDLPPAIEAAYDAPFPSELHKSGARALPALVFSEPDQNAAAWTVLESWTKPFTLVWAPEDPIVGGGAQQFLNRVPGTQGRPHATITGASHFLFEDKPDQVTNAILTALATP